jgi:hypothetical protein
MRILPIRRLTLVRLELQDRIECSACGARYAAFEAESWSVDQNPLHDEPEYRQFCECCAICHLLESASVKNVVFEKRSNKVLVGSLQTGV